MFPSSADYVRHHRGRVAMLALGAATTLAMAALLDVPSVRAVDTAIPALVGDLAGEPVPARHDPLIDGRLADVLARVDDGRTVVWRDPETGATFRVHPLASFTAGDRSCRSFTVRRTTDDGLSESYRTACLDDDGAWTVTTTPKFRSLPCRRPNSPPAGTGEPDCPSP